MPRAVVSRPCRIKGALQTRRRHVRESILRDCVPDDVRQHELVVRPQYSVDTVQRQYFVGFQLRVAARGDYAGTGVCFVEFVYQLPGFFVRMVRYRTSVHDADVRDFAVLGGCVAHSGKLPCQMRAFREIEFATESVEAECHFSGYKLQYQSLITNH